MPLTHISTEPRDAASYQGGIAFASGIINGGGQRHHVDTHKGEPTMRGYRFLILAGAVALAAPGLSAQEAKTRKVSAKEYQQIVEGQISQVRADDEQLPHGGF